MPMVVMLTRSSRLSSRAVRGDEFLGGIGAGASGEPRTKGSFMVPLTLVSCPAGSVEGQVLVALVGDVDDKADVAR